MELSELINPIRRTKPDRRTLSDAPSQIGEYCAKILYQKVPPSTQHRLPKAQNYQIHNDPGSTCHYRAT